MELLFLYKLGLGVFLVDFFLNFLAGFYFFFLNALLCPWEIRQKA